MQRVWRIELLGTLIANQDGHVVSRFRTRRVASLLAYLAYFPQRVHSRDELASMLWPDADIMVARRNLRQALFSLRHVLEPASFPVGSVLKSLHDGIQLNGDLVTTDIAEFEAEVDQGRRLGHSADRASTLARAVSLYKGDLLPGFLDDWIWPERMRLEDMYLSALSRLSEAIAPDAAIDHLRQGVIREPFNEEWHRKLMERYLDVGRPEKAIDQYAELTSALLESFGQQPSPSARRLAEEANRRLGTQGSPKLPVRVHDLVAPSGGPKLSLPVFTNRYFGRTLETDAICSLLESGAKLVTILGPAGVGKTRLSVRCASALADRQPWNIWFVPMADRFHSGELYEAIVAAMDPRKGSAHSEIDRIIELAAGRPTLLVLDNLEQISDGVGILLERLLVRVPELRCLASSRHALQVESERIFGIEPLPAPPEFLKGLDEAASTPSVQLFVDRCQTLRPDFQLNERNWESIVELCNRLDGLPLAIEIAAGLSNSFSPAQMLRHLPARQTDLTSRRRDIPERHRSLRSAIDWSYDLLAEELQTLFCRLCVFRGGFTIEAATEVCLDADGSREACLHDLQRLQERSLLRSEPSDDGRAPRFRLLNAFREYGEERLQAEALRQIREGHAEFYLRMTAPDRPFRDVSEQTAYHLSIEQEYDNFIAALEYSISQGNLERAVSLLGILAIRWLFRGPKATERRLIRQIADHPSLDSCRAALRVQAQRMLGTTYIRSGEYEAAYGACERAVEIALAEQDRLLLATCYSGLSICAGYRGNIEESLRLNEKVLQLVGGADLNLVERSYLGIGAAHWSLGQIDEASTWFDRARAVSAKLRGGEPEALIVINQARCALDLGKYGESLRLAYEAIRISRRLHDDFSLAVALMVVSRHHLHTGNLEAASATNLEALDKCKQGDFLFWILQCLRSHAAIWAEMGRYRDAAILMAATSEASGSDRAMDVKDEQRAIEKIRSALTTHQFESAWAKGLAMDRGEAIRFVGRSTELLTNC
ncbi:MAG: tetratricopeptide repeat protein [Fimbriimonas sp.]|nr:tetratricopeptide repeat protein [Fimbriimonas sp.]